MGIKKIISSIKRSQRKRQVVKTILSNTIENTPVINVHSIKTSNAGDYFSGPHHYFDALQNTALDIHDYSDHDKKITENFIERTSKHSLIIGGGGLLNRGGFQRQMKLFESLSEKGKKNVLWGVGHNAKDPKTYGKINNYNVDVSKFGLVGTRDFSMPGEWVPCVSCLHSIFDKTHKQTHEIGVVFHLETSKKPEIVKQFEHIPSTSNISDFEKLIGFIGSSEKIITDSYHAMYWSMLLGKKVVVVPNSSKFYDFKYQPVFSDFENALNSFSKAKIYSGLLEECRAINLEFGEKVFDYLDM